MKKFILVTVHRGCFGKEVDRMYVKVKQNKKTKGVIKNEESGICRTFNEKC